MSKRPLLAMSTGLAASLLLVACSGGDEEGGTASSSKEDGITIALATEPNTLDGQRSSDGNARIVIQNVAEELVQRDVSGDLIPGLASSMPEPVGDTTWRLELREGVSFHNGEELTADLVVANLERAIDPDAGSENMDVVGTIASIEATESMVVEVTTNVPDPLLPTRLAVVPIMAEEVLEGDTANSTLIGTGPYEIVEWNRGESIEVAAFEDYWGDTPPITTATFRFIPDPGSQEAGLRAGEIDLITNLSPDSTDSVPQVFSGSSGESPAMVLNTADGVTADVNVRRAMNMAIDQAAVSESLFGGRADPQQCQMANPRLDHYNASLESYEYDLDEARRLIQEAGAEGATVEVVGTSGRWLRDRESTEAVAAAWQEIGLAPDVQILEFNAYLDVLFDRSERPDSIYISAGNPMLSVQSTVAALYSSEGGQGSHHDPKLNSMIEEAGQTVDEAARTALLDEILAIGCEDAIMGFLPEPENLYGGSENLEWQPEPDAAVRVARMSWK